MLWEDGATREGTAASKQNPRFPGLLGYMKTSTFLEQGLSTVTAVRMFVKRRMSGDVGRRKSHFFRWRRKAEMDGGRGVGGVGAASKGDP